MLTRTLPKVHRKVQEGEVWFVPGKKGMGKTTFIKNMIKQKTRIQPGLIVYHVDSKGLGDYSSRDGTYIASEAAPPALSVPGSKMVWRPLIDDKQEYTKFFLSILRKGLPAIVNIDEIANMVFNGEFPRGLQILIKQCRLPGIHLYGGTQEIGQSGRQFGSQADFIACFNLINEYDERIMLSRLRKPKEVKHLDLKRYQFEYIRPDYDSMSRRFNSYEELLGEIT